MVKLSSLHDKGRPDDVLHQLHPIELVIALRMVVISSILDLSKALRVSPFGGNRWSVINDTSVPHWRSSQLAGQDPTVYTPFVD